MRLAETSRGADDVMLRSDTVCHVKPPDRWTGMLVCGVDRCGPELALPAAPLSWNHFRGPEVLRPAFRRVYPCQHRPEGRGPSCNCWTDVAQRPEQFPFKQGVDLEPCANVGWTLHAG